MANTVPILQIPIDDSRFRAFLETFEKFKLEAADVPNTMAEIERAIDRLPEHLRPGAEALEEAAEAAADALDAIDVVSGGGISGGGSSSSPSGGGGGASGGGGGGGSETGPAPAAPNGGSSGGGRSRGRKRGRRTGGRKQEAAVAIDWALAGFGARRLAGTIGGATRDLAKWDKFTGTFYALLGTGTLFYGLDKLAGAASRRRQESAGYGMTTGELASFRTNYGRLGDVGGVLEGLSGAETDFAKRQPLQSLGVDPRGKSSLAIFGEILPKLKNIADRTDPRTLGPAIEARGLDKIGIGVEMMRLIRSLPPDEIATIQADASRDAATLGIPDDVGLKWQELNTALHKAETRFQTVVAGDLVALTPGLQHLSTSAVNLIDRMLARPEVARWLDDADKALLRFAGDVGSDDAQTKIRDFVRHFDMAQKDFDALNSWLESHEGLLVTTLAIGMGWKTAGPAGAAAAAVLVGGHYVGQVVDPYVPRLPAPKSGGRTLGDDLGLPGVDDPVPDKDSQKPGPAPAGSGSVDKDISGDLSASSTYGRRGEEVADPQAFIVHHTGGGGSAAGVVSTLNQRGLGVQYVLDRDGHIFRTLPEGHRGAHILPGNVDGKRLSNDNTLGMEVIARDDSDVTPAQVAAARKFYADLHKKYPHIEAYGHGYVNPGHKMASEGKTITDAIRADERSAAQGPARDPVTAAREAAVGTPVQRRGFMSGYAGRDDVPDEMRAKRAAHRRAVSSLLSGHPDARPRAPQSVVVTDNSGGSSVVTVAH